VKSSLKKFLLFLIPFALILLSIQYCITSYVLPDINLYYSPWAISLFLFITTFVFYLLLVYIHNLFPDKTGFSFLGFGMLKMFVAILFLIPLIRSDLENKIPATLFFFASYFLYMFIETLFSIRLLNKK
jgi:uncharacterized membrane protein YcgQ (UPF0703/DUF1980 family)